MTKQPGGVTTMLLLAAALAACGGAPRFDHPEPAPIVVAPLPAPQGPFAVGSLLLDVDDPRPAEQLPEGLPRVVEAQVWYPAADDGGTPMPYIPRRSTAEAMITGGYWSRSPETITTWLGYSTFSVMNPLPAPRRGGFPLLLFAPSPAIAVANYTALLEGLASHGFVVVAVSPRVARAGSIRRTAHAPFAEDEDVLRRAADIGLVLRRFIGSSGTVAEVAQAADLTRAGVFGHVTGTEVALAVCAREQVVRRCAAIDGAPTDEQVARGAPRPILALRSTAGGDENAGAATRARWLRLFAHEAAQPGVLYRVEGMDVTSPTDAPWVMEDLVRTEADPERMLELGIALLTAFFEGGEAPFAALEPVAARYSELLLES